MVDLDEGVTAAHIAEHFDVTDELAQRALELLADSYREEQAG